MRIEGNEFYMVTVADDRHIYGEEEEAINHLRESVGDLDPGSDDVSVVKVNVDGGDWTIKELPWQQIALQLLKGE